MLFGAGFQSVKVPPTKVSITALNKYGRLGECGRAEKLRPNLQNLSTGGGGGGIFKALEGALRNRTGALSIVGKKETRDQGPPNRAFR